MEPCEVFGVVTVIFAAAYVYYGRDFSFETLALGMFFPALFSPWFAENNNAFFKQTLGLDKANLAAVYSVFAGILVILIIGIISLLVIGLGWGKREPSENPQPPANESVRDILAGFVMAAGEEVGWRCYMLPCLMAMYPTWKALLYSGIIWGLFHVPVMILLTNRLKPPRPFITIVVQCLSVVLSAFPHGWVAVLSGYSFWAPTVMHFTWNRINPVVLGSIYTQDPGLVKGDIWLINGEGLAGCLVMLPVAAAVVWDLS